jgi:glycosyltransferase involved in cell wall biosynthesis
MTMETQPNPIISVIIPTFNRAHLLGRALQSVKDQTVEEWECIVVDDGSTDNTAQAMQVFLTDKRFRYITRPADRKKGADACRNIGLTFSSGQYVNFLDSDDWLYNHKFETQLRALKAKQNADVVIGKCDYVFETEKVTYQVEASNVFLAFLNRKIKWQINAPLWKKKFLTDNNISFHEDLKCGQDWDFHVRAILATPQVSFVNDILSCTVKAAGEVRIGIKSLQYLIDLSYSRKFVYEELKSKMDARREFKRYMKWFVKNKLFILSRYRLSYFWTYIRSFDFNITESTALLGVCLLKALLASSRALKPDS